MSNSPILPEEPLTSRSNDSLLAEIQYALDLISGASERIDDEVPASCEWFLRLAALLRDVKPGVALSADVIEEVNDIVQRLFTRFQFHDAVTQMLAAATHSLDCVTDTIQRAEDESSDHPQQEPIVVRQRFIRPDQTTPVIELF